MKNPNGPYPGRQIFIGATAQGQPAFAYLVTGRSPASRERRATPRDNGIIMGPLGDAPYDWLRHYTAVKYDNSAGLLAVTNGIQTEAVYETYRLLHHTAAAPDKGLLENILGGAGYEPDSLKTPRIAAVITGPAPACLLGIVTGEQTAAWEIKPQPGRFYGVSTYHGDIENPGAYKIESGPAELDCGAAAPQEIAQFIYDISAETYKDDDIRVCAVGGVRTGNAWATAIINRHPG